MRGAVAQDTARRAAGLAILFLVIGEFVEEALDFLGSVQASEYRQFGRAEVGVHWDQGSVVLGRLYCTYAHPAADRPFRRCRRSL